MKKRKKRAKFPSVKKNTMKRLHTGTLFIIVGAAAIVAAAAIWFYNEYDNRRAAESSQVTVETILEVIRSNDPTSAEPESGGAGTAVDSPDTGFADPPVTDIGDSADTDVPPVITDGGPSYVVVEREAYMGILSIPGLSLILPVNTEWSYSKLRTSPCRYSGDVEHNDFVIAAHSYRSHFGNINTLSPGDTVIFTDVNGRVSVYYVAVVEVVHPSNTRSVVTSIYDLTLFTCTFDSRSRVVVRCFKVKEPEEEQAEEPGEEQAEEPAGAPPEEPEYGAMADTPPQDQVEEPAETPVEGPPDEMAAENVNP